MFRARDLTTQREDNGLVAILRAKQKRNSSIFCSSLENDELKNEGKEKEGFASLSHSYYDGNVWMSTQTEKKKLNKKRARNKEQDRKTEKEFLRMRRKIQKIRSRGKLSLK